MPIQLYRVFDVAGNASFYQRKGVLLTGFTSTITAAAGGAAAASLSVEVEQNTNVMSVLNDFNIVTTSGNSLRNTERIVQSVYYNGMLISTRSAYDVNTLSTLDTTVPGSYRIVYTIERRDGAVYVEGNSVELNVTVKPNVANVAKGHFNYSSLIVMSSVIVSLAVAVIFLKKKKII